MRSGFGRSLAFRNPSLQFVQRVQRLLGESSPPAPLLRMWPIVSRTVREALNGSASPAAQPQTWQILSFRCRTHFSNSFLTARSNASFRLFLSSCFERMLFIACDLTGRQTTLRLVPFTRSLDTLLCQSFANRRTCLNSRAGIL